MKIEDLTHSKYFVRWNIRAQWLERKDVVFNMFAPNKNYNKGPISNKKKG
jgi:hypothetical protein